MDHTVFHKWLIKQTKHEQKFDLKTLSWYQPRSYHLRLSSYNQLRHITFFDTWVWVFTSRGPPTSLTMSFLNTRSSSEDVVLNGTLTTPISKADVWSGLPPKILPGPM